MQGDDSRPQPPPCTMPESAFSSAWARLIDTIYEVDLIGGSCLRSKQREPVGLSPLFLLNAHSCRHHRPGRGEKDSPPSGEARTPSPRIASLGTELTVIAISVNLTPWGEGRGLLSVSHGSIRFDWKDCFIVSWRRAVAYRADCTVKWEKYRFYYHSVIARPGDMYRSLL